MSERRYQTSMNPHGVKMLVGYVAMPTVLHRLISLSQGGFRYGHVLTIYDFPPVYPHRETFTDGLGYSFDGPEYTESLATVDAETGKTGLRGPFPLSKLLSKITGEANPIAGKWNVENDHARFFEGEKGMRLLVQDVPPRPGQTRRCLHTFLVKKGHTKYPWWQTGVQQALHQLLGYNAPSFLRSPNAWNCTEAVAHGLCPKILIEGLDFGGKSGYDSLTPRDLYVGLNKYWKESRG